MSGTPERCCRCDERINRLSSRVAALERREPVVSIPSCWPAAEPPGGEGVTWTEYRTAPPLQDRTVSAPPSGVDEDVATVRSVVDAAAEAVFVSDEKAGSAFAALDRLAARLRRAKSERDDALIAASVEARRHDEIRAERDASLAREARLRGLVERASQRYTVRIHARDLGQSCSDGCFVCDIEELERAIADTKPESPAKEES